MKKGRSTPLGSMADLCPRCTFFYRITLYWSNKMSKSISFISVYRTSTIFNAEIVTTFSPYNGNDLYKTIHI